MSFSLLYIHKRASKAYQQCAKCWPPIVIISRENIPRCCRRHFVEKGKRRRRRSRRVWCGERSLMRQTNRWAGQEHHQQTLNCRQFKTNRAVYIIVIAVGISFRLLVWYCYIIQQVRRGEHTHHRTSQRRRGRRQKRISETCETWLDMMVESRNIMHTTNNHTCMLFIFRKSFHLLSFLAITRYYRLSVYLIISYNLMMKKCCILYISSFFCPSEATWNRCWRSW